jgi:hypothetical protein
MLATEFYSSMARVNEISIEMNEMGSNASAKRTREPN